MTDNVERLVAALEPLKPSRNKPGRKPPLTDAQWRVIFAKRRSGVTLRRIYEALLESYVSDGEFFYSTFTSFKQAAVREKLRLRNEKQQRREKRIGEKLAKDLLQKYSVQS